MKKKLLRLAWKTSDEWLHSYHISHCLNNILIQVQIRKNFNTKSLISKSNYKLIRQKVVTNHRNGTDSSCLFSSSSKLDNIIICSTSIYCINGLLFTTNQLTFIRSTAHSMSCRYFQSERFCYQQVTNQKMGL